MHATSDFGRGSAVDSKQRSSRPLSGFKGAARGAEEEGKGLRGKR